MFSRANVISPNGLKTGSHLFDRREVIMPAFDVQREIDMTNLRSVGFDLRYVILFFGCHFFAILIKT